MAASASAQTQIGADLSRPANFPFDCRTTPPDPPFFVTFPGRNTCTYVGTSITGESTATPFPGGVITRVRVKTSAPTGPMRATVVRALSTTTAGFACCFYGGQSQVFTPQANATTAVNVRLPVRSDLNSQVGQTVDYLGISVLAPGVAVPASGPNEFGAGGSLAFFPQIAPSDSASGRVDGFGNSWLPLLNADFTPLCGGGLTAAQRELRGTLARRARGADRDTLEADLPPVHASGAGGCLGGVTFGGGGLSGSRAVLPVQCNLTTACTGRVVLKGASRKARAAASKTVGKAALNIPPGQTGEVKVKLRRAARGRKRLKVRAKATVDGGPTETAKLKLKR